MTRCFPGALETVGGSAPPAISWGRHRQDQRGRPGAPCATPASPGTFRVLVGADSCARCKPYPDPVLLALRGLGGRASVR